MTAAKNRRSLTAAGTAVAVSSSVNSGEWNNSTGYGGGRMIVRITNGVSAPTVAPTVTFFTGGVSGEKVQVYTASGNTSASNTADITFVTEQGDMFLNATVSLGAATNGVTIEVFALEATTI